MSHRRRRSKSPTFSKNERIRPRSREDVSRSSSRASTVTPKVRESSVLTDGSLATLARELGGYKLNCLELPMYLCIPNTTIVHAANGASSQGLIDATETTKKEVAQKLLLTWKELHANGKERDKLRDLERALREMGKGEVAEMIMNRHSDHQELTADAFANL